MPDPMVMAPFAVGDFIDYSGIVVSDEVICFSIVTNLLIISSNPGYIRMEDALVGIIDNDANAEFSQSKVVPLCCVRFIDCHTSNHLKVYWIYDRSCRGSRYRSNRRRSLHRRRKRSNSQNWDRSWCWSSSKPFQISNRSASHRWIHAWIPHHTTKRHKKDQEWDNSWCLPPACHRMGVSGINCHWCCSLVQWIQSHESSCKRIWAWWRWIYFPSIISVARYAVFHTEDQLES